MARTRQQNKTITFRFVSAPGKDVIGKATIGKLKYHQVFPASDLNEVIAQIIKKETKKFKAVVIVCGVRGCKFYGKRKFTLVKGEGVTETKLKAASPKSKASTKPADKKASTKKASTKKASTKKAAKPRAKKSDSVQAVAADAASVLAYATAPAAKPKSAKKASTKKAKTAAKPKAKASTKKASTKKGSGKRGLTPEQQAKGQKALKVYQRFIKAEKAKGATHKQAMAAWKKHKAAKGK